MTSQRILGYGIAAAAVLAFQPAARAKTSDVTVSESLPSIPENANITLLNLGTSGTTGFVSDAPVAAGGAEITFSGGSPLAGIYSGTTSGVAAAPFTATGPDTANYLASEPGAKVTLSFASEQQYYGMEWGSVDAYNTLSFYNNGTLIETLTGSQISTNANGNQTADGTYIVNVDFTNGLQFNSVVATTTSPAFEFNSIAYAPVDVPITASTIAAATIAAGGSLGTTNIVTASPAPMPRPGASPLGGAVLAGSVAWLRRRRAR